MEQNSKLDLTGDIFFVNKITFLVTLGQQIKFMTVENLKYCKSTTIMSGLKSVINFYETKVSPLELFYG